MVLLQTSWQVKLITKSLELFIYLFLLLLLLLFFFLRMKPASLINQKRLNQVEQHEERLVVYHWNYYFVSPISSSLEKKKSVKKLYEIIN